MSPVARRRLSDALAVIASVALLLALVAGYVQRAVADSDQFADRATAALRDEGVRALLAERITDDLVLRQEPDLIAARPLIQSALSGALDSGGFASLFRAGVRDVHRAVFDRSRDTVTLTVADVGTVAAAAVERLRPALARDLSDARPVVVLERDLGPVAADAVRFAERVRLLAAVLLVVWLALVAAAIAVAPERRRAVVALGAGAAVVGVVIVVGLAIARSVALDCVGAPDERAAAAGVWEAFLGDLRATGWLLAGCGAVVAAAAASLIRPVEIDEPLRRLARAVGRTPEQPAARALRGLVLVGAGVALLVARDAVLSLLVTLAGAYLIYAGATILLRLVERPAGEAPARPAAGPRRRLWPAVLAGAVVAVAVGGFVSAGGTSAQAPPATACNGSEELCERPLHDVALAATHNAMSVPLPGWFSALQDGPIPDQLAYGIRGLLLDTHYADRLPNGRFRTDLEPGAGLREAAERDGLSPETIEAALRIRARAGFSGEGERGIYLCHTFCELGATALDEVLRQLHDFLVANPGEVVVLVNQDAITPEDFVAAVRKAELERFAYAGPITERRPTLGEMVSSGRRLVLLAENESGGAPWYRPAYEAILQETPFAFSRVSQLTSPAARDASCAENRGPPDAPLFLLNHWITNDPLPRPSQATQVNAYEPLFARARACERLRGRPVNLVAVDFYRRGDLLRVIDALNGVDRGDG